MEKNLEQPILIVGMPRSGTKLLRALINNSPEISIPPAESIFIPALVKAYGNEDSALTTAQLDRIYTFLANTAYYWNMSQDGVVLSRQEFDRINLPGTRLFDLIGKVLQYYSFALNPEAKIFGDKSPYYRGFLPLLKQIFPEGRIIHIIRDPRDVALSTRNTWGRSMLRAAQDWKEQIPITQRAGRQFASDYHEVRFEDLLADPDKILTDIFKFLDMPYKSEYSSLTNPSEDLGSARGVSEILTDNTGKFIDQMPLRMVRRINQIVYPTAVSLGYVKQGSVSHRPLSPFQKFFYKQYDAAQSLGFHIRHKGLFTGIRYIWQLKRVRI
jgi:hypothetical protein